ncbi:ATP/GTP-binding protein [Streptomyces sp. NPDC058572]|uniref:ATP/GTP-binding protein n=1 Tax=Streptomyces sp. NPDC058572 TaxID=3346546 RepID=UPI0036562AB2
MLRRAAVVAVVLAVVLVPVAYADDGRGGEVGDGCDNSDLLVTVCAQDGDSKPGAGEARPAGTFGGGSSEPPCMYTRMNPQPPRDSTYWNMYWKGHSPGEKGAIYRVTCPATGRVELVWIADGQGGPQAPQVDPEVVARRAVDSMLLAGPKVASPRAGGRYVVGMPMWLWVEQSPTTYGPNTASATAGGVTVTATAKVSSIEWAMGDGSTVTCTGPGTRYDASKGKAPSPDCGHRYKAPLTAQKDGKYHGTATATWTVEWQAAALGDAGQFTEVRETAFAVDVREVQVLN